MTKEEINNITDSSVENFKKLSIQVSLNGLSFCVFDTVSNTISSSENVGFAKELTLHETLKRLEEILENNKIHQQQFSEVVVVHRNNLFGFVPQPLFDAKELANYLKFNTKILINDHLSYDELEIYDLVNVYVPFVNINNYIYDLFGEFTFKHSSTILVESLLKGHSNIKEPVCYVHVDNRQIDITVISQKRLLFHNSFRFITKEDFLYYLLFTLEQLKLNPESISLKLFGTIKEDDDVYEMCYKYIKDISIFIPLYTPNGYTNPTEETVDFTVINAL